MLLAMLAEHDVEKFDFSSLRKDSFFGSLKAETGVPLGSASGTRSAGNSKTSRKSRPCLQSGRGR
jgi:hypothetical protein